MRTVVSKEDISEIVDIWKSVCWRMNVHRITPKQLADLTGFSQKLIERGINGEPIPVRHALPKFVEVFGLTEARDDGEFKGNRIPNFDECKKLLRPPPAMPPRQGNFWEYDEE